MKKDNLYCWLLIVIMVATKAPASERDPFQPFDLSRCSAFTHYFERWHVKGVLISELGREALLSHPSLGIKRIAIGMNLPSINGQVTQIELSAVEIRVAPPCLPKLVKIRFKGDT
ncbi:hypothetical protein EFZ10_00330 [Tatumella sp. TA1]|uniref:hypothetical protein n=1 Tax=Rosenbergiella collisarenosi TaxID=1544695 RepID=UPI0008F8221F|nr:hypothetical protein [Rosenbergiella collisarenosi]QGX90212.1 hypothetical protein EFZ10_00330 [Tatumella sp. TA1]